MHQTTRVSAQALIVNRERLPPGGAQAKNAKSESRTERGDVYPMRIGVKVGAQYTRNLLARGSCYEGREAPGSVGRKQENLSERNRRTTSSWRRWSYAAAAFMPTGTKGQRASMTYRYRSSKTGQRCAGQALRRALLAAAIRYDQYDKWISP
jgi:hypothetical protein